MKTEVVKISSVEADGAKIAAAARILDEGGVVAFPTETVYGMGCRAEAGAIAGLNELKGRPADKRYTLHIADREEVHRYVPWMPPHAAKLVKLAWPGPVTIVFQLSRADLEKQKAVVTSEAFDVLYSVGTIGIRCVDNEIGQSLLGAARSPIVAPSANRSGEKPAVTPGEVLAAFEGRVPMILTGQGADCRYGAGSTVVKVTDGTVKILRQGVVKKNSIDEMSQIRILFLCTGNTCRSPMAEGFCRRIVSEKLNCSVDEVDKMSYKVASAGVMAVGAIGASPEAVQACKEKGVEIGGHRSRALGCDEAKACDYIFALAERHRKWLGERCPEAAFRCVLLDSAGDIPDPIGASIEVYRECAKRIEKAVQKRIGEIWHENSDSK